MVKTIMVQGCGSNVGKSLFCAGLCRYLNNQGLRVMPFKPQNMANNAAVTADGGEIGRAQALQAKAARVPLTVHMNPVLLKPESDRGSQIIVQGRRFDKADARSYKQIKPALMPYVAESFETLQARADWVIVEGAGSPAEINLRENDIANMGFARKMDVPVLLLGDIDRGGVIAQLVGTKAVLPPEDEAMIRYFAINKFRGDPSLFNDGYRYIEDKTGWQGLGVLPWFSKARDFPAEDSLDLSSGHHEGSLHIAFLALPRIANFDDLDPLKLEPNVKLTRVDPGKPVPGDARLVIIPGSKSTRGDLDFLKDQGWDIDLRAHLRRGGYILGICGGYQILGTAISDPNGIEGPVGFSEGLGMLEVTTQLTKDKSTVLTEALHVQSQTSISAYEIHLGESTGPGRDTPFSLVRGRPEGAVSANGRVMGTYLHGLFASDSFRQAFLEKLGAPVEAFHYENHLDGLLDELAEFMAHHLDLKGLFKI